MVIFGDNSTELSGSDTTNMINPLFGQLVTDIAFYILHFNRMHYLMYICCRVHIVYVE